MNFLTRLFGASVPELSALELQEKLKTGKRPFLLDVRQPEEYRAGHIAGAKLIPLGELKSRMTEVPEGREIVCICATGHRSVPAARKLIAAGHATSSMKNGMTAWQQKKFPVKKGMAT
jgi:rhodanese-related sulfurtransferase